MQLEALKEIPSSVSRIAAGDIFHEPNPELAKQWLATGYARVPVAKHKSGSDMLSWPGVSVAILASGPSLSVEQCEAVRKWRDDDPMWRKVITINTTFRRAPWADLIYACDSAWWSVYADEVTLTCAGQRWTQDESTAKSKGLMLIKSKAADGLSREVGLIHQGASSGYQAINLAYQSGAVIAYLLGYDNKGKHWHPEHPAPMNKSNPFARWAENYVALAADCKAIGFDVINCTPKSALKVFPEKDWAEVFG